MFGVVRFEVELWFAVWHISDAEGGWDACAEGPCKCRMETRSLSCWSMGLADLPPTQLVPKDILKLQVLLVLVLFVMLSIEENCFCFFFLQEIWAVINWWPWARTASMVWINWVTCESSCVQVYNVNFQRWWLRNFGYFRRDINDNAIEHLPISLFFPLHNVTHLRLSRNILRELDRNQFIRMRNLEILYVIVLVS